MIKDPITGVRKQVMGKGEGIDDFDADSTHWFATLPIKDGRDLSVEICFDPEFESISDARARKEAHRKRLQGTVYMVEGRGAEKTRVFRSRSRSRPR